MAMAATRVFPVRRNSTPGDSDDTDISMPRSIPRKRIPSQEWEKKRPIITRLYQEEKKPLKEVMEILERDHNFTATCVLVLALPTGTLMMDVLSPR